MKFKLLFIYCIFSSLLVYGQSGNNSRNAIFFEFAGSGGLGSINFEHRFFKKSTTEITWRTGLSIAPIDKNNGTAIIFPNMVHVMVGKQMHKLELGLGQGFTLTTKGSFFALSLASIGYRYQANNSNWFFRVSYTPLISYIVDFQIQQWGGISIGYKLKSE